MPNQTSETPFTVDIVGDRRIAYSERDLTVDFFFDLDLKKGPNAIFLETQPWASPPGQLAPALIERDRLVSILEKVVKSLNSMGYTATLVSD